jgi:hypothetical protein
VRVPLASGSDDLWPTQPMITILGRLPGSAALVLGLLLESDSSTESREVRQFGLELLDDVHEVVIDAVADADAIKQRIEPFC